MNVWFITMNFPIPSETFAVNDVCALKDAQVEVSVHALRAAHPAAPELTKQRLEGVPVTHGGRAALRRGLGVALRRPGLAGELLAWTVRHTLLSSPRGPKKSKRLEQFVKSVLLAPRVLDLFEKLEREKPDAVHLFWGHYPAMVAHLVQKRHPEIVSTVFLGAYDLEAAYGGSAPVASQADVVWTHAEANVSAIKQLGVKANLIRVAYRGVELKRFRAVSWQRKVPKRIVAAGRLASFKKMDDVLRVFQQTLRRWPDATLVVLGDGPERERLEALSCALGVAHAVTFRGHVAHAEVFEEMAHAEVFLLMSQHGAERLPNVVKEAMGCRCVCVTTQTPGIGELLAHGEHGFIVAQGDVEAAARHIDAVFAQEVSAQALTEAAYKHLERSFDIERLSAFYQSTWRTLAAEKQRSAAPVGRRSSRELRGV